MIEDVKNQLPCSSPVVAHYGWEIIGGEAFSVDLCCIGPLLMESTVCDHHIHVYWPGSKMAAAAILELGTVPISEVLWSKSMCYLCRTRERIQGRWTWITAT